MDPNRPANICDDECDRRAPGLLGRLFDAPPAPLSPQQPSVPAAENSAHQFHQTACLNLPYPSPIAARPDARTVCVLQPLYAGQCSELTAVMQYSYDSLYFDPLYPDAGALLKSIAICEMHHLELLGRAIVSLGGKPVFCGCRPRNPAAPGGWWTAAPPLIRYNCNFCMAILENIDTERRAISDYQRAIRQLDDSNLCALVRRIILDEENHIRLLEELYCRFGS